jgi:hypothetical protein
MHQVRFVFFKSLPWFANGNLWLKIIILLQICIANFYRKVSNSGFKDHLCDKGQTETFSENVRGKENRKGERECKQLE